jgi:hypothetical protein
VVYCVLKDEVILLQYSLEDGDDLLSFVSVVFQELLFCKCQCFLYWDVRVYVISYVVILRLSVILSFELLHAKSSEFCVL